MCKIIDAHVHVDFTSENLNLMSNKNIEYMNMSDRNVNDRTINDKNINDKNRSHINRTQEFLSVLQENCIYCIINSDNSYEYEMLRQIKTANMIISAGIHPWKADVTDWNEMKYILQKAEVIGEIGLDCVWCDVDLKIQQNVFLKQLELAMQLKKPVVLHTKGMEKEILEIIKQFPNRYLVHWYSCENYLEEYIALGCWFTIGPAIRQDKTVEMAARKVPLNRLLIESDGLEGISWGQGREIKAADYKKAMEEHLRIVAEIRGCETKQLLEQMKQNLESFIVTFHTHANHLLIDVGRK